MPPGDPNITDTLTVNFKYDATGNMTEMDDGPGKVKYVYDTLGRLTEERRFFDSLDNPDQSVAPDPEEGGRRPFILKYEYNLSGKLKKFIDPWNDFIEYSYNNAGLLTSVTGSNFAGVTNYVTGIQYRAWGAPKQASYGSGHTATSKYSARTQIQQYDLPGVMGATYAYNPDKQIKTMMATTDANPSGYDRRMDRSFLYDHAGRIIRTRASNEAGLGGGPNFLFRQDYGYDAFGNMTNRSGAYWPGNNGDGNGYANMTYTNNKVTAATGGETWTYDGMGYLKKVTRYNPNDPSQPVTLQDNVIDAVGKIVEPGAALDGAGQVVKAQFGQYYLRSRVFGGQIATSLLVSGEKSSTRVYVSGGYLAEQIMAAPYMPEKVRWHFRDPLNTMSKDIDSDATSLNIQAIDPLGVNVKTTDGVNLNQYYSCLYNPGQPSCSGNPPPSFYTPENAYGAGASGSYSVKVDGALTIYSVGEIAAQLQRQGIGASVLISPALNGTPLTQGLAGVRRHEERVSASFRTETVTEDIKDEEGNIIYHERDEDFIFTVDGGDHFEYSGTEYVSLIGGEFIGGSGGAEPRGGGGGGEPRGGGGGGSVEPEPPPNCGKMLADITVKAGKLVNEIIKYDPVSDGRGGHIYYVGGQQRVTKPGGHYQEITDLQRGLKNDITDYIDQCIKNNKGGGGGGSPVPRWIDEMAGRPVPPPVYSRSMTGADAGEAAAGAAAVVGVGYLVYRGLRLIPSLFFPPSIPLNLAIP